MTSTMAAVLIGILLGIALIGVGSWAAFLTCSVFGIIGWAVASVMDGRVDVVDLLSNRRRGTSQR